MLQYDISTRPPPFVGQTNSRLADLRIRSLNVLTFINVFRYNGHFFLLAELETNLLKRNDLVLFYSQIILQVAVSRMR